MAIDHWLLEQHRLGKHPSVLRFYTWNPPAISLGYHQRRWPESWQHLRWQGISIDLVRRPTGGRAVLHQGDLTYAVVTSGLAGSRSEIYQLICEFLIQGWRSLGLDLHYGHSGSSYSHNPDCFGTATVADLVRANGTKFIGSAQLRRGNALLQHGSMRLAPDPDLLDQVFGRQVFGEQVFGENLLPPSKLLKNLHGDELRERAIGSLTAAACRHFGVELVPQPLSEGEWEAVLAQPLLNLNVIAAGEKAH